MKKIVNIFVIMILFLLPFMVNAKDNVEITQVKLHSKTTTAEVGTSTFDGLTVDFDVKFSQKDDEVVYKILIKNNENKSYELEKGELANSSKHIKYVLDYDGGDVIKAKSTKEATVSIKYYKLVDDSEMVNGRFVDTNKVAINLRNSSNPQTSSTGIVLVVIMLLLLGSFVLYKSTPKTKLVTIMVLALLVPVGVLAASKLQIVINAKVEIVALKEFCIIDDQLNTNNYKYAEGMTFDSYCNSELANIPNICTYSNGKNTSGNLAFTLKHMSNNIISCLKAPKSAATKKVAGALPDDYCFTEYQSEYTSVNRQSDKLTDKSKGCYYFEPVNFQPTPTPEVNLQ